MRDKKLKKYLDSLYDKYHRKYSSKDPVWILHEFDDKRDIEIAGFITSCYSYGRVESINEFIKKILKVTGNKVHEFTSNYIEHKDKKYFKDLNYRFNTPDDLSLLFVKINKAVIEYGSLEKLFCKYYSADVENILPALSGFTFELNDPNESNESNSKIKSGGKNSSLKYLIPLVSKGSACKRLNLYLRWMVRKDNVDTGIWENVSASKLIMPVDTHVYRVSKLLKLAGRNSCDLKFAEELTHKLKTFDNEDPVRYDFAICHAGMEGLKSF